MRDSVSDRLLRRELQDSAGGLRKVRSIYGDKNWIHDLDIVNELDGHSGCVNALRFAIPPSVIQLRASLIYLPL
jgi:nuclear receptor interaction protein